MLAEQGDTVPTTESTEPNARLSWLRVIVGLLLGGLGLWFVTREVDAAQIATHLRAAQPGYIALGLLVIVVTIVAKAWRWQLLFHPSSAAPGGLTIFKALTLGQFVNVVLPFVRLGELARVYALGPNTSKARGLGTLVVEKTLDTAVLMLTVLILLPFVVLPTVISNGGVVVTTITSLVAILILFLLAYQTTFVVQVVSRLARLLPLPLERRLVRLAVAGLEGLAALRSRRITVALVFSSAVIGVLSVLTPLVLFPAFGLQLGWPEAALIHIAVTVGSLPPSTPARIGIFEAITAFMLEQFGLTDRSLILGYSIIFHLVVVLPQILLGIWATSRTGAYWQWRSR